MYFDARAAKLLQPGQSMAIEGCPGLRIVAGKSVKTWIYRHRDPAGALKQVRLGAWPSMSAQAAVAAWSAARDARSTGVDLVAQRRKARQEAQAATRPQPAVYDVARLVDDYITGHIEVERKAAGATAARNILQSALQAHPALAAMAPADVTRQHAFDLIDWRKATPTQAQKLRSLMGAAWDYALDAGRIDGATPNWWRVVMRGRLRSKGKIVDGQRVGRRRRYLTDAEVATLLAWLPNMHQLGADVTVMYLWTGTRGAEILSMRAEHVVLDGDVLWWTVPKALTKNARFDDAVDLRVPLFGRARGVVQRRLDAAGDDGLLFVAESGRPYSQHDYSTYIYDLQPYSPKSKRLGRQREVLPVIDWTAHNLRRTARTMLAALGCPNEVGEAIVGHMPRDIEATYNAHSYDAERLHWLARLDHKLDSLAPSGRGLPVRP
ncbi:hypothetical protein D8I35_09580 [Corticibacter populi]|uniref:Tyr recombinase domain-containing protein n=1 Tax=Corticibacter populi TaxID=1550736 RepID=A0A3M6QW39_9BURK|nr:tyrosine-type recombinase/integrase [Corticibacter populi]RMX06742.1 hypothetical protein D8I35_09580 [Corticibacter populi]RZS31675.1 phage integrase family protein [Corticibacter populi]